MALLIQNIPLFSLEDGDFTSDAIDVSEYKQFGLYLSVTEGGSGTASLTASYASDGVFLPVADSSQSLGTGAGGVGWDVTSQFPFYKIAISGASVEGSTGRLVAKQGQGD